MLVAGSKNIDGYKAWIYANLLSTKDEDVKAAARQQLIEEYDWTDPYDWKRICSQQAGYGFDNAPVRPI